MDGTTEDRSMAHTTNGGVTVERHENDESYLSFETALDGLNFAETVFREARRSALLQQVAIIDKGDQKYRKIGYISAIERSTDNLVLSVSFIGNNDAPIKYNVSQIELVQKDISQQQS